MNDKEKKEKITKLLNEAKEHFKNARHNEAVECYTKAIELDPKNAVAYNNRGVSYKIKGEYDKAIIDHSKVIELNPEIAEAYYNRGITYKEKGEYDKAIADFNKAIELDPKNKDFK